MESAPRWLKFPLFFALFACMEEESPGTGSNPANGGASAATAGASTTAGSSTGGASTQGGATPGGATQGGAAGTSTGDAGQTTGGASPGGAGGNGNDAIGGAAGNGVGPGGAGPGGMGGVAGTNGGLAGAPAGGAGSGDNYATDVTITVHPSVRTILNVAWNQTTAAQNVFLEFTFEAGNVLTSRPKAGTVGMHTDVVLGAPGNTPVTVRVVSRQGGVDYKTRDYMGTTGMVPTGMPVPQVMTYEASIASPERWMLGAVENSGGGCNSQRCYYNQTFWVYIMDRKGRIVWYYSDAASNATSSFQRIARDGGYIWIEKRPFSSQGGTRTALKRTLDGSYSESVTANIADCIDVTDSGSLLYDSNSQLMELPRGGQPRMIFNCRTHFPQGFQCYTNTINWNPRDDTVLMSYPDERTVIEVKRSDGTVVGQYGAAAGSYTFAATPAPPMPIRAPATGWEFNFQHFANISKDGTLMVSTHMPGYRETSSPVAGQHAFEEYTIDRTARTLTMRWFYQAPGEEWAMYKGMAMKLPNNNVLANFGTGGIIREITQDKRIAFMVKFDAPAGTAGNDFFNKMVGHNVLIDDLYALNVGGPGVQ